MQTQDITTVRELLHCVRVLGEILDEKERSKEEDTRIKFVGKMLDDINKRLEKEQLPSYYIFNEQTLVGKLDTNAMELTIGVTLAGTYSVHPLVDKDAVTAYQLEPKK